MPSPALGYKRTPEPGNPRNTEGWALLEAARRMRDSQSGPTEAILSAVRLNWKLWTIFQANLLEADCPVPADLRANMLTLSGFVDKRSAEVISAPTGDKLAALININLQIGGGLLSPPPAAAASMPMKPMARPELVAVDVKY